MLHITPPEILTCPPENSWLVQMKCPVKDGPFLGDILIFRGVLPKKPTWQMEHPPFWRCIPIENGDFPRVTLICRGVTAMNWPLTGGKTSELHWITEAPPRHIGSLPMQQCTWRHKPQTYVFFFKVGWNGWNNHLVEQSQGFDFQVGDGFSFF